ncbi:MULTISPECIES: DMT family transporter [Afipia]|nr:MULTISPECIES: DMT family transporter [Afipia]MAH68596.1 EamA/RhaT family transporter [Afipia sp.]HAO40533.1 EamA/RhaT family transporter [Afipia sp.]HAP13523.1 EamA/RhaT family transporter [Afipia sp.]HAP49394.1 EamA/RhaT family transporter [Afipia sp.]HBF54163.1 EamA/RhaT family transporter [Afipia sp.]
MNRPYLLLSLSSLFWAGNIVLGRFIAADFPPMALSFLRWAFACLIVLPFAWPHLRAEWPVLRKHLPILTLLTLTGLAGYNAIAYLGLRYTEALNALLIQSSGPLIVALWSFVLLGIRLTWPQTIGIGISLLGVLTILSRGDPVALTSIHLNKGDLIFTTALIIFGLYSVLAVKRPAIHPLTFMGFTSGYATVLLIPAVIAEAASGHTPSLSVNNALTLAYVAIFPSILAYLFFNRGVELIGANRAAPFFHLIPVFGSVLAIAFLGERPQLFHVAGYALVLTGVVIAARRTSAVAEA